MSNLKIKNIQLPSGNSYVIYDLYANAKISVTTYAPGVAYNEGDLIIYEDALYRVTEDITAIANTKWEDVSTVSTSITNEFARVWTGIKDIKKTVTAALRYIGVATSNEETTSGSGEYKPITDGSNYSTIRVNDGSSWNPWIADSAYDPDKRKFTTGAIVISGSGSSQREFIWSGSVWNEFGSTGALKDLAFKDHDEVYYDKTTSATASGVTAISSVTPTSKHLTATASGGAATITSTAAAITGFGTHSKTSYVESYPGATSKLVTSTASKATAGTAVSVAKKKGSTTTVSKIGSGSTSSILETASVSDETLIIGSVSVSNPSIQECDSTTESITPYTFSDVTVATGGIAANGTGDSVMTGLGTPTTSLAITALGTATTANCATAISLSTQPTITLDDTQSSGGVTFVSEVSSSSSTTTPTITLSHTTTSLSLTNP